MPGSLITPTDKMTGGQTTYLWLDHLAPVLGNLLSLLLYSVLMLWTSGQRCECTPSPEASSFLSHASLLVPETHGLEVQWESYLRWCHSFGDLNLGSLQLGTQTGCLPVLRNKMESELLAHVHRANHSQARPAAHVVLCSPAPTWECLTGATCLLVQPTAPGEPNTSNHSAGAATKSGKTVLAHWPCSIFSWRHLNEMLGTGATEQNATHFQAGQGTGKGF